MTHQELVELRQQISGKMAETQQEIDRLVAALENQDEESQWVGL